MDVQVSMPPPPPPPPFFAETTTSPAPPPPPTQSVTTTTANVATPPTQDRIWLHPWTVTEMRDNASNWSLAGDAGVLLYLEQFSDKLTQRADAIQQHLHQTVNAVKSTHTRVQNCLNEFTSLANTQFIENRVYDEDETAGEASKKDEQSTDKSNVNNTEAQEKVLQRYVEAIQYGLAILDTHFERVETKLDNNQNGGSSFVEDDEDGGVPLEPILEPKDPYIFRPLPHLIGTTEFMQDDYVGLGELLTLRDEDGYEVEQTEKVPSDDSALSSSDDDDDEEQEGEEEKKEDFQAQMSPAPLVPAGASVVNRPPPTSIALTDSEDDDDDPFGIKKNLTKIDNVPSKPATANENLFDDEIKPPKKTAFALDSDNEENDLFDSSIQKSSQPIMEDKNNNNDLNEKSASSSDESDEPEEPKQMGVSMLGSGQKGMSELEKAILEKRRKLMGDSEIPRSDDADDDDDEFIKKPTKVSNKTTKTKGESSSSSNTISNLTSQPLTTPSKISKPSIFGDDDDNDDLFSDTSKPTIPISSDTKTSVKLPPKKEKDMFDDDSDEGNDLFAAKPSSTSTKKIEPIPQVQPILTRITKPIIHSDESDDDTLFVTKKPDSKPTTIVSTPSVPKNTKPPTSDDELFPSTTPIPKSQPTPSTVTKKVSDDEDPLFGSKPSVPQVVPSPVVVSSVKKPSFNTDEDSDDGMFVSPKKLPPPPPTSTTSISKVVISAKSDDDDDGLFKTTSTKTTVVSKETLKSLPTVISDEEDDLFPSKQNHVISPPSTKTKISEDPLGIEKSAEPTSPIVAPIKTPSTPLKENPLDDDSDENSTPNRPLNPDAVQEGQKTSVSALAQRLKIPTGAFKPASRPKPSSVPEEPPKSSVDDDQPIQNIESPPLAPAPILKKTSALDSDSDDELFNTNKKKVTPTTPIVEPKKENETGKSKIKELSSLMKTNLILHTPGAQRQSTSNVEKESNNTTPTTSKEEPTVDTTMIDMFKTRAKGPAKRAPQSRKNRATGAAAASTSENDDLVASSNSTTTAASPPSTPTAVPVTPRPAAIPIIPPPEITVPVTGLPDKSAAIATISAKQTNSKEKKKFSLFDSDDSDIDELLFGFSKKTKSSVVSKPATSKATAKPFSLPLDNDDDDILLSRPPKNNTKPADNDDFLAKRPPKENTKTVDNDDFLSKRLLKENTKPVDNDDVQAKRPPKENTKPVDDDDFLAKRPSKKSTKPVDDDIFADVKGRAPQVNKAKKDWSILDKSGTDPTDDILNDISTKSSSTTTKPKTTSGKTKPTKNFDMFDDPLDVLSKR